MKTLAEEKILTVFDWRDPSTLPSAAGLYERRTKLGVTVDYWDGEAWYRAGKTSEPLIKCANQHIFPWRRYLVAKNALYRPLEGIIIRR